MAPPNSGGSAEALHVNFHRFYCIQSAASQIPLGFLEKIRSNDQWYLPHQLKEFGQSAAYQVGSPGRCFEFFSETKLIISILLNNSTFKHWIYQKWQQSCSSLHIYIRDLQKLQQLLRHPEHWELPRSSRRCDPVRWSPAAKEPQLVASPAWSSSNSKNSWRNSWHQMTSDRTLMTPIWLVGFVSYLSSIYISHIFAPSIPWEKSFCANVQCFPQSNAAMPFPHLLCPCRVEVWQLSPQICLETRSLASKVSSSPKAFALSHFKHVQALPPNTINNTQQTLLELNLHVQLTLSHRHRKIHIRLRHVTVPRVCALVEDSIENAEYLSQPLRRRTQYRKYWKPNANQLNLFRWTSFNSELKLKKVEKFYFFWQWGIEFPWQLHSSENGLHHTFFEQILLLSRHSKLENNCWTGSVHKIILCAYLQK